ncbi:MAG: penicillin-binding transpeptidase domain-containing protein, partial [Planctomycetota bacterium]
MNPDALIPSMFHRRLLLLLTLAAVGFLVLIGQLYRLTVLRGSEMREDAEHALVERELLPTYRGRILDRHGRVLAADRPCFDLMVDYRLISDGWADEQAWRAAKKRHLEAWSELSPEERVRLRDEQLPRFKREVDRLWNEIAETADVPVESLRGTRSEIRERVERMASHIWRQWQVEREREFRTEVTLEEVRRPIREQRQAHVILHRVDPTFDTALRQLADRAPRISRHVPGVSLRPAGTRDYPYREHRVVLNRDSLPKPLREAEPIRVELRHVAEPMLGAMRDQVFAQDIERRPLRDEAYRIIDLGGYIEGDHVGSWGLEGAFEDQLRGTRGMVIRHLDTGMDDRTPPVPGGDLQLTIDIELQARVEAILDPEFGLTRVQPWHSNDAGLSVGTPLNAAAVVIEVDSGEILAMATSPAEPRPEWIEVWGEEELTERKPELLHPRLFSLATRNRRPPGSIVKPLIYVSGVSEGVWPRDTEVVCNGHYFPQHRNMFRCWSYRAPHYGTHGPLAVVESIARSCNIYFYAIGDALGPAGVNKWYRRWGAGESFNLGIPHLEGHVADPRTSTRSNAVQMGIGQGELAWTPLHAAAAYAALARGGYFIEPALVRNDPRPDGRQRRWSLNADDVAVTNALRGLWEVVNNQQYGGARHIDTDPTDDGRDYEPIFNLEDVVVWGKTGTAQEVGPR